MKRKLSIIFLVWSLFFSFVLLDLNFSKAQNTKEFKVLKDKDTLPISDKSIKDTIKSVLDFIFKFIAGLSILMIVVSGVWYIVSAGDQDATEDATDMLIFAVTGLVVALLGMFIVKIIYQIFGATFSL